MFFTIHTYGKYGSTRTVVADNEEQVIEWTKRFILRSWAYENLMSINGSIYDRADPRTSLATVVPQDEVKLRDLRKGKGSQMVEARYQLLEEESG